MDTGGFATDFDFEGMEGFHGARSTPFVHEIGVPCPCMMLSPKEGAVGHSDPTCDRCSGFGYLWRGAAELRGIISNVSFRKDLQDIGWVQQGDMFLSMGTHPRDISDFDRITIRIPVPVQPMVLVRGKKSTYSIRYDDTPDNSDVLEWEAGEEKAIWVEDEDGVYYEPACYVLKGRYIEWVAGPAVGKKYTIKYKAYPEYICWATPTQNFDGMKLIGPSALMRKIALQVNPKKKQIRPPWQDRVSNATRGNHSNKDAFMTLPSVEPSR